MWSKNKKMCRVRKDARVWACIHWFLTECGTKPMQETSLGRSILTHGDTIVPHQRKKPKMKISLCNLFLYRTKHRFPSMLFFSFIVLYKEQWKIAWNENPWTFGDLRIENCLNLMTMSPYQKVNRPLCPPTSHSNGQWPLKSSSFHYVTAPIFWFGWLCTILTFKYPFFWF